MLARSIVPIAGILALQAGILCHTASAATATGSLSVSVTVEAGCLVAPAQNAPSGTEISNSAVAVNCTLPVPYQVTLHSDTEADLARLSLAQPALADSAGLAYLADRDHSAADRLLEPATGSEPSPLRAAFFSARGEALQAGCCNAANAGAEMITVTVVY